jgi:hypothetical protein
MRKQSAKNKLMDLFGIQTKETDGHIIICFDEDQIPDRKQGDPPMIVFKDFSKEHKNRVIDEGVKQVLKPVNNRIKTGNDKI